MKTNNNRPLLPTEWGLGDQKIRPDTVITNCLVIGLDEVKTGKFTGILIAGG